MKRLLFLIIPLVALNISCKNGSTESSDDSAAVEETTSISVDEFFTNPETYVDQTVSVSGLVTHVCKHGGQKLFIAGNNDATSLRIETGGDISEFDLELEGSRISFTGVVKVMDEAFIAEANAEEKEHHGEEAEKEVNHEKLNRNMDYYLVASSFETIK